MKISFLIPTRGKPVLCYENIRELFDLASDPSAIEVIVRADRDDSTLVYLIEQPWGGREKLNITFVVGSHQGGYRDLNMFYEDCARSSTGDLLVLYNDDFTMLTRDYDQIIKNAWASNYVPIIPRICNSDSVESNHSWSCPIIPRKLYKILGEICPGQSPVYDRAWEAVAKHSGAAVKCDVVVNHTYKYPVTGSAERDAFNDEKSRNRSAHVERWDREGRMAAEKIMRNL